MVTFLDWTYLNWKFVLISLINNAMWPVEKFSYSVAPTCPRYIRNSNCCRPPRTFGCFCRIFWNLGQAFLRDHGIVCFSVMHFFPTVLSGYLHWNILAHLTNLAAWVLRQFPFCAIYRSSVLCFLGAVSCHVEFFCHWQPLGSTMQASWPSFDLTRSYVMSDHRVFRSEIFTLTVDLLTIVDIVPFPWHRPERAVCESCDYVLFATPARIIVHVWTCTSIG